MISDFISYTSYFIPKYFTLKIQYKVPDSQLFLYAIARSADEVRWSVVRCSLLMQWLLRLLRYRLHVSGGNRNACRQTQILIVLYFYQIAGFGCIGT